MPLLSQPVSNLKMLPKDRSKLDACIERLKSKDSTDREKAAIEVFHFASSRDPRYPYPEYRDMAEFSEVVEPLIAAFDDSAWKVRANVATALGRIKHERALQALERKLTDENEQVRKSILHALSYQEDPKSVSSMIDRLVDVDPEVRWTAAYELGNKKSRAAIVPLIMVLESEEKPPVRQGARDALIKIANGLDFGDRHSDWQAWLLKNLQEREGRVAGQSTPQNLNAIEQLIRTAVDDADPSMRLRAEEQLTQFGVQAFDSLFAALKDSDWRYRYKAARILAFAQNSVAIDPLTAATKDENADVRETAKKSLETLRLNIRLSGDRKLIGEQDFSSLEGLKRAVFHEEAIVRRKAAIELGRINEPEAVKILITPLLDEDSNVRIAARDSLRQRKEPEVVDALNAVLQYESIQRNIPLLVDVIGIVGDRHDPSSIRILVDFLHHEDMSVRQHTISVLGKFGTSEALLPLIESLHDESDMVQRTAAAVLANCTNPAVIEPLIDSLSDPDDFVKESALSALIKITGQNFEDDIAGWQEWWIENQGRLQE